MKIAMLTNNYRPFVGGVPVSVERQAGALRALGHEVTVFAPDYGEEKGETEDPGDALGAQEEHVIRCGCFKRRMKNGMVYPKVAARQVREAFERESFDCVHVHQPVFMGNTALWLKRRYQVPVVYTWHTKYQDYLHYFPLFRREEQAGPIRRLLIRAGRDLILPAYMRWFTGKCDLGLAPAEGMRRQILETGVRTPLGVLPTGRGEGLHETDERRAEKIREKYLQGRRYLFCTVSRLEREKNIPFLLEGMRRLKEEDMEPFRLLVIGKGTQRASLEELARKMGLEDEVTFTGNIPNQELKHYLAASDLFLFASRSETQGIVIQEALACGCPVVAVRATGVEDAVEDGRNGYLAPEDVDAWCLKVWKALEGPAVKEMRARARASVRGCRSVLLAMQAERMYEGCLEKRRKEAAGCADRYAYEHGEEPSPVSFPHLFKST